MGTGILICGLNGSGKSTLGKALANVLKYHFIDIEDMYFPHRNPGEAYSAPLSREEAQRLLQKEISEHENFVFASVKGDFGEDIIRSFNFIVLTEVPKEIRANRIRERSFAKFGDRMLPGGDLYRQEEAFFRMADTRRENYVESWLTSINLPVVRVDGTKPVKENIARIANALR